MTTSTLDRPGAPVGDRDPWTCDNCQASTRALRKRCTDCGTSRY